MEGVRSNFRLILARKLKRTFNVFPWIAGSCSGLHSFTRTSSPNDRPGHERLTLAIFRDSSEFRNGARAFMVALANSARNFLTVKFYASLDSVLLVRWVTLLSYFFTALSRIPLFPSPLFLFPTDKFYL